jgi:uncharacterized membrane protein YfcA
MSAIPDPLLAFLVGCAVGFVVSRLGVGVSAVIVLVVWLWVKDDVSPYPPSPTAWPPASGSRSPGGRG